MRGHTSVKVGAMTETALSDMPSAGQLSDSISGSEAPIQYSGKCAASRNGHLLQESHNACGSVSRSLAIWDANQMPTGAI